VFEEARVPKRQLWFYVPHLDQFFLNDREEHAIAKAFKYHFGQTRWEQIEDTLESLGSFHEDLNRLSMKKIRRKLKKAREQESITATELKDIKNIVSHLNAEVIL
jgi:protoporphyrinogen oxidase